MKFFKSIKFRLTIWYLVVIVVLLLAFGVIAYFMLSHNLYQNLDDSLKTRVTELRATLAIEGGRAIFAAQPNETLLIYDTSGTLQQRIGSDVEFNNIDQVVQQALGGQSTFFTATGTDGEEVRLYAVPFNPNPMTNIAIVVGRPTTEIMDVLGTFRNILEISGLVVILLGCMGGWFLANRALRPVNRITRTAQEIGETDLSRRIDVKTEDELGRLASTLNGMIERLEGAFDRQRQFTTDASHELRTPLAVVQAESTLVLSKERTEAEYRKSLELISQETAYMSAITNKLLFLARSDAGKELLNIKEVNLKELLAELSPDVEVLVKEKGVQFRLGPVENLTVKGDLVKLRQLLLNDTCHLEAQQM
jgi:signal transduction histidine kinase